MKTFSRCPPLTTMFSAVFEPAQLESWLMSILAGLGAAPSNFTVPLTLAAVAGSIGVAAGAAAGAGAAGCSSAVSFLPHPASRRSPSEADRLQNAVDDLFFILYLHLSSNLKTHKNPNSIWARAPRRHCCFSRRTVRYRSLLGRLWRTHPRAL